MLKWIGTSLAFLFLQTSWSAPVRGNAVNLYIENDSRNVGGPGSDNAYSNGIKLSYISSENDIPAWAQPVFSRSELLKNELAKSDSNFGISIGQQLYTPNDIRNPDLIVDDRPYAAWLYLGFSAHFKNAVHSHSIEVDVGVVGPEAGGEKVQNGFHKVIGTDYANGWSHQLATEPTLQISYQQRVSFFSLRNQSENTYFDVIPFFGGGLGNVAVEANIGGLLRFGHSLPDDFGPSRPSATDGDNFASPLAEKLKKNSFYTFAGGRLIAVGRNIFLDGNTFHSSQRVKKRFFVVETEFGVVGIFRPLTVVWRFVTKSPEFEQRSVINSFASLSVAYDF